MLFVGYVILSDTGRLWWYIWSGWSTTIRLQRREGGEFTGSGAGQCGNTWPSTFHSHSSKLVTLTQRETICLLVIHMGSCAVVTLLILPQRALDSVSFSLISPLTWWSYQTDSDSLYSEIISSVQVITNSDFSFPYTSCIWLYLLHTLGVKCAQPFMRKYVGSSNSLYISESSHGPSHGSIFVQCISLLMWCYNVCSQSSSHTERHAYV